MYVANQRKQNPPADEPEGKVSLYEAQRRRTLAQAEREELKNKELAGELVRRDAVEKALFRIGREVRDGLENLPARLSGIFAAESSQDQIFALLSKELQQVLEVMAQEVKLS